MNEGPSLEELTRYLAESPLIFLAEPKQSCGLGRVDVAAVVADLTEWMGGVRLTPAEAEKLRYPSDDRTLRDRPRLRLALLLCRPASHPGLCKQENVRPFLDLVLGGCTELAKLVPADQFVNDPERREELVRFLLSSLDLVPAGESSEEAEHRLDALSSVKRDEVIRAAQEAELRARKVREELARQEAERQAASVYSYE